MLIPINYIILEGVDLSGKTSLYNEIHKKSHYKWNIHDRSFLSMLVYAKLYNRNVQIYSKQLRDELTNLNNRMIWCHPKFEKIKERYQKRGDDIQNLVSLEKLYDLFEDHDQIKHLPNVKLIDTDYPLEILSDDIIKWLGNEKRNLTDISETILKAVSNMPVPNPFDLKSFDETISLTMIDDNEPIDISIFDDEEESEYYLSIIDELGTKIENEFEGINEYNLKQDEFSRRFIYTSNTCISLFHALYRRGILHIFCNLRSSNVSKTIYKDLNFIVFLARQIKSALNIPSNKQTWIEIKLHSAHLIK